jgi:hypothetical protein
VKHDEVFFQLQQPVRPNDSSLSTVASGSPASLPIRRAADSQAPR